VNAPKKYDIIGSARRMQRAESDCPVPSPYFTECFYTSTMLHEFSFMTNNKTFEPDVF